ncbi:lipopolysaccharide heptosyltransferase I [soil metagenome]
MILKSKINKILVIKFGGIGDVLLATPVITNLKAKYPDSDIYFLTLKNARDVIYNNPYLKKAMTFDSSEDSSLYLIKRIRKEKFDLVIDLYSNPRTALLTFLSGAKYKAGFNFRGRAYAYNELIEPRGGEVHNVQFNLDALRKLEIPIINSKPVLFPNPVHFEFAENFIVDSSLQNKKLCAVLLTGGWESKRYKADDYIELLKLMKEKFNFEYILVYGNNFEKAEAERIKVSVGERIFIFPNRPLLYLAALIKKCDIVLGSDSGPLHVAAAMETPLLGIFGPTDPKLGGPYGEKVLAVVNEDLDCLKCNLRDCPIGNICMTELSKVKIMDSFEKLVSDYIKLLK